MFEVIVTACIAASGIGQERLPPLASPGAQICARRAEALAAWAERRGLAMSGIRCAHADASVAVSVQEIAPRIFVHRGRYEVPTPGNAHDLTNLRFLTGDDAVTVIGAGGSRKVAEGLYAAVRMQTDLPIRWLILAHMHPDHVLGTSVFREAAAEIWATATSRRRWPTTPKLYRCDRASAQRPVLPWHKLDGSGSDWHPADRPKRAHSEDRELRDRPHLHQRYHTGAENRLLFHRGSGFSEHTPALDGSIAGCQAEL